MKYSKQRELIFNIVNNSMLHPTAEMVYEESKKIIPNISLGTVYRNLENLEANNLIKHIIMPNNSDRYDKTTKDHHHFYCEKCHEVYDLFSHSLDKINDDISKETGYMITKNSLVFTGVCKKCQKKG